MKKPQNNNKLISQIIFFICLAGLWQLLWQMKIFPELMFPSVPQIGKALADGFLSEDLGGMVLYSLGLLVRGFIAGTFLAFVFSGLALLSRLFRSIYNLMVSMFDLIPGVALLPLAILWIGIGEETILFLVIHSVLWPMSRNLMDGFASIPEIYTEVGVNIGLSRPQMVIHVYLPAAFSSFLSGLRVGWARAWRGLISAEMIFGTTSSGAGIGWFILMKRTYIDLAGVIAAILVIIGIGVIVEYLLFGMIEKNTLQKWGMSR